MDELHRQADKLRTDLHHLDDLLNLCESEDAVELALSVAKRVRRNSNLLVRQLAELRDKLQP